MARVRTRFPTVFIGHPFGHRFPTNKFRKLFRDLPFKVIYGNTDVRSEHLLSIMKNNIKKSDFSIFDLSDWNPNVSMELGLAEGLQKRSLKRYYILLNTRRTREVPADVRGIQRLEYTRYDFRPEVGLGDLLVRYVLQKEYWVKKIMKEISASKKAEKSLLLCLRIIAHLRDNEKLASDHIELLTRGTRLRRQARQDVLNLLKRFQFIRKIRNSSAYRRYRSVF